MKILIVIGLIIAWNVWYLRYTPYGWEDFVDGLLEKEEEMRE